MSDKTIDAGAHADSVDHERVSSSLPGAADHSSSSHPKAAETLIAKPPELTTNAGKDSLDRLTAAAEATSLPRLPPVGIAALPSHLPVSEQIMLLQSSLSQQMNQLHRRFTYAARIGSKKGAAGFSGGQPSSPGTSGADSTSNIARRGHFGGGRNVLSKARPPVDALAGRGLAARWLLPDSSNDQVMEVTSGSQLPVCLMDTWFVMPNTWTQRVRRSPADLRTTSITRMAQTKPLHRTLPHGPSRSSTGSSDSHMAQAWALSAAGSTRTRASSASLQTSSPKLSKTRSFAAIYNAPLP